MGIDATDHSSAVSANMLTVRFIVYLEQQVIASLNLNCIGLPSRIAVNNQRIVTGSNSLSGIPDAPVCHFLLFRIDQSPAGRNGQCQSRLQLRSVLAGEVLPSSKLSNARE